MRVIGIFYVINRYASKCTESVPEFLWKTHDFGRVLFLDPAHGSYIPSLGLNCGLINMDKRVGGCKLAALNRPHLVVACPLFKMTLNIVNI